MVPLLGLGSKSTSLKVLRSIRLYDIAYFLLGSFFPCLRMLILALPCHYRSCPLLGLGSKSTSFRPGFCISSLRQCNTCCWELNLISGFFAFLWFIVWQIESINVAGVLQEARNVDSRAYTKL